MSVRRPSDGGLRALYRKHIAGWQWTALESPITSPGVPDSEFCSPDGVQGWLENKWTTGWKPVIRPLQVGWIDRRARLGSRVFVAVRRMSGEVDELWIVRGLAVKMLCDQGLRALEVHVDSQLPKEKRVIVFKGAGGPAAWNWEEVKRAITGGF